MNTNKTTSTAVAERFFIPAFFIAVRQVLPALGEINHLRSSMSRGSNCPGFSMTHGLICAGVQMPRVSRCSCGLLAATGAVPGPINPKEIKKVLKSCVLSYPLFEYFCAAHIFHSHS